MLKIIRFEKKRSVQRKKRSMFLKKRSVLRKKNFVFLQKRSLLLKKSSMLQRKRSMFLKKRLVFIFLLKRIPFQLIANVWTSWEIFRSLWERSRSSFVHRGSSRVIGRVGSWVLHPSSFTGSMIIVRGFMEVHRSRVRAGLRPPWSSLGRRPSRSSSTVVFAWSSSAEVVVHRGLSRGFARSSSCGSLVYEEDVVEVRRDSGF